MFQYSTSFDHCGPLARTVHDCALLLGAIAGYDLNDPTTTKRINPDYTKHLDETARGLRVGLPRTTTWVSNEPDVTRLVDEALRVFVDLGMDIREIDLPYYREAS